MAQQAASAAREGIYQLTRLGGTRSPAGDLASALTCADAPRRPERGAYRRRRRRKRAWGSLDPARPGLTKTENGGVRNVRAARLGAGLGAEWFHASVSPQRRPDSGSSETVRVALPLGRAEGGPDLCLGGPRLPGYAPPVPRHVSHSSRRK